MVVSREALDKLELVDDLAALVGDLLLRAIFASAIRFGYGRALWTYESSSLALAPSLRETCSIVSALHVVDKTLEAYVDGRHGE